MSDILRFEPESWRQAARPFDGAASRLQNDIMSVTARATDSNRIGSAQGLSTFDTVATGVLAGLGMVMQEVTDSLVDALGSEADLLVNTGKYWADTEDANQASARSIEENL